ncbi:MAG: DUF4173 domain-containing protein [Pseudomonadota bacterium]
MSLSTSSPFTAPLSTSSLPRQTLLFALVLGVVGDELVYSNGLTGPALLILLGLLLPAAFWLTRQQGSLAPGQLLLWGGVALLAAALRLWSALPILDAALLLVIASAAAQILLRTVRIGFREAAISQQLLTHIMLPLQAAFGGFPLLSRLELKPASAPAFAWPALRGALLAIPLLLLFARLFAAADATFESYLRELPALLSESTLEHLFLVLFLSWLCFGLLAAAWRERSMPRLPTINFRLGDVEVSVLMGLLALLFVVFAALQLGHLLQDADGITRSTGLTIADYARRGFFQLAWIAALALIVLQLLAFFSRNQRLYAGFAALLLVCVLILLASAVQRMGFYIVSFGLSIDRIMASAVMLWLTGCLLLFASTVLRNRSEGFASGVAGMGMAVCLALALMNPAALVTRVNIERSLSDPVTLDTIYLSNLGADAVPTLLEYFPQLPAQSQCEIATLLIGQWLTPGNDNLLRQHDWRRWNHAYNRAVDATQANAELLRSKGFNTGQIYYGNREELPCA